MLDCENCGVMVVRTRYGEPSSTGYAGTSSWILERFIISVYLGEEASSNLLAILTDVDYRVGAEMDLLVSVVIVAKSRSSRSDYRTVGSRSPD